MLPLMVLYGVDHPIGHLGYSPLPASAACSFLHACFDVPISPDATTAVAVEESSPLWSMLYADDACIVSRTSSNLEKMMTVTVTACREFGLTVSEAKTETMLLHSQTGTLSINVAGQAYKQANNFCIPGGINRGERRPLRGNQEARTTSMGELPKVQSPDLQPTERGHPPQGPHGQSRSCRSAPVRVRHMNHAQRPLHSTSHSPPCIAQALSWMAQAQSHRPRPVIPRDPRKDIGCESIETTVRKRRLHFAGFITRVSSRRIPKQVMFGELIAGKGQERQFNGRHEDWLRCLSEDMHEGFRHRIGGVDNKS